MRISQSFVAFSDSSRSSDSSFNLFLTHSSTNRHLYVEICSNVSVEVPLSVSASPSTCTKWPASFHGAPWKRLTEACLQNWTSVETISNNDYSYWERERVTFVSLCSFLWAWPTTRWSGRVYGGSWAAWHAALPLLCARRADTHWSLLSLYAAELLQFLSKCALLSCCESSWLLMIAPVQQVCWFCLQHTVSVDSRNSAIFPSRGALLRINQVSVHT